MLYLQTLFMKLTNMKDITDIDYQFNLSVNRYQIDDDLLSYIASKNALQLKTSTRQIQQWIESDINLAKQISEYYKKYNKHSFGRIDSIRQIDKTRIQPPINSADPIGRTLLPDKYISKIDRGIKKHIGID